MKELIKQLREVTGAGMLDCQKALKQTSGDFDQAKEMLIQKLGKKAEKKQDRATNEGIVATYVHGNKKMGAMVTVKCETDFVAKNDTFINLANTIAMQVGATNPSDVNELLSQGYIKDPSITVQELINQAIGKIGENITIGEFKHFVI